MRLLEIGVEKGSSMRAWEMALTNEESRFYGVAYTDSFQDWNVFENKLRNRDGRTTIVEGDQSDSKFLVALRKRLLRAEP